MHLYQDWMSERQSVQNEREFPVHKGGSPAQNHWAHAMGHCPASLILIQIYYQKQSLKNPSELPQKNIYSRNITFQTSDAVQVILNSRAVKSTILVMELFL